jgi:hypothetical protein
MIGYPLQSNGKKRNFTRGEGVVKQLAKLGNWGRYKVV